MNDYFLDAFRYLTHMIKRREMGNYDAANRFICVAIIEPHAVHRTYNAGTQTFDLLWRAAEPWATHLVLRSGQTWIVTSMIEARMQNDGHIVMGNHKLFDSEEAAIMCAVMMASQGKESMDLKMMNISKFYKLVKHVQGYWATTLRE